MKLTAIKYIIFAGIATTFNITIQWIANQLFPFFISDKDLIFWFALFLGTFIGFLTKYILDKKYIFYYKVESRKKELYKFSLYSLMGIITTIIFWGIEFLFEIIFPFEEAKYIGALVGLSIGYTTKYFLDKRFVFVK